MKPRSVLLGALVIGTAASLAAQSGTVSTSHPDFSGTWLFSIGLPPLAIKKQTNGVTTIKGIDASANQGAAPANIAGAKPSQPEPVYKPEFRAKVKDLADHESKTDEVFYCGRPGIPRIGPPRRIVQLATEMIFLYEDISGDPYRIVPTDGRPHKKDGNPTYYGDSVGHWEGNTLVVESVNFVDSTWFGEEGYFHSDAMRVVERFWKNGANLVYQVTVEDPKVLASPWTMAPRVVKPSTEPLEESPKCTEADAHLLVNNDHHGQR